MEEIPSPSPLGNLLCLHISSLKIHCLVFKTLLGFQVHNKPLGLTFINSNEIIISSVRGLLCHNINPQVYIIQN